MPRTYTTGLGDKFTLADISDKLELARNALLACSTKVSPVIWQELLRVCTALDEVAYDIKTATETANDTGA